MRLYRNSDNGFTLVTHDLRLYKLDIQEEVVLSQFVGRITSDSIVNGVLLRNIPNILKHKCFTLNKKKT